MRITTLETVHNHKKIIKKTAWWYHRKLEETQYWRKLF